MDGIFEPVSQLYAAGAAGALKQLEERCLRM